MCKDDISTHPLAEVFGFPPNNTFGRANRFRKNKLCPFNNRVPSCTKDKANNPLGVCSICHKNSTVITCPVRFREDWSIADEAADFFFSKNTTWTTLTEVNLNDAEGKTAGHIDLVIVSYDERGQILDFGSVEIQAVYISGNIRKPFEHYMKNMENPSLRADFSWKNKSNYPKPDFLSSSRKRLIPQVLYKGGILDAWSKKQVVVLQSCFFDTLPEMPAVEAKEADIAWLVYDLKKDKDDGKYSLKLDKTVYTKFKTAMHRITTPEPGQVGTFVEILQQKLDDKLDDNPPDAPILNDTVLS